MRRIMRDDERGIVIAMEAPLGKPRDLTSATPTAIFKSADTRAL